MSVMGKIVYFTDGLIIGASIMGLIWAFADAIAWGRRHK